MGDRLQRKMLLIVALFAVALASVTPHHPQWPADFSTTSVIHFTGQPRPDFIRWFYSKAQNVDRVDGLASMRASCTLPSAFSTTTPDASTPSSTSVTLPSSALTATSPARCPSPPLPTLPTLVRPSLTTCPCTTGSTAPTTAATFSSSSTLWPTASPCALT